MEISAIISHIEHEQFALPEFQRGYVWGRDDVRSLFDSLYRRYPVGGFLVWLTRPDPETLRGREVSSGTAVKLLLDGQQRATSLYGVMRGHPPEFFQGNEQAFTDLYFNVRDEVFEFYGPVKMRDDPLWVSVTKLFESEIEDVVEGIADHTDDHRTLLKYQTHLVKLKDIGTIKLHIEEIVDDKHTIDEVVEIFNRVNSGGTHLSSADLALARLCAHSPQVRNEVRRLLDGWAQAGFNFTQEWLLRCATAVATNQSLLSSLRRVSVSEFSGALKSAARSIDFLLNLLHSQLGVDRDGVLKGKYALVALTRLVSDRGGSIYDVDVQQRILYWYLHCTLWGRYSSSLDSRIQRDLEALNTGDVDGLIAELTHWRFGSLEVRPDDFDSSTVGARFYPLLYILTRVNDARDLCSGLRLSHSMFGSYSNLHLHHIFPKKRLYDAKYTRGPVNAVANFCFLTAECNWKIKDQDPAVYLAEVEANNPGVLKSQWIPDDRALWSVDRYPEFLAQRRILLAEAANELLDRLQTGRQSAPTQPRPAEAHPAITPDQPDQVSFVDEDDPDIAAVLELAVDLGISTPETHHEICDDDTGDVLVVADIAWPQGIQPGRTQPVAVLLAADPEAETQLGERGFRFFTSAERLVWYLEELLGVDIDGEQVIGEAGPDNRA